MTTTLEKPTALKCACPGCNCTVQPEIPFRSGALLFCSDACAKGHPNGEPCHAGCGRSRHGWFCDGAHLGTGWLSRELLLEQAGTVMVCGCAHSHRYPLCDGSHAKPPDRRSWWKWWA
jgi:CDGSH-type Zn-finger protein